MTTDYNPMLLADFYKLSHRAQYPEHTETVYSTWIPRSSHLPDVDKVVAFGLQIFIKDWLISYFNRYFFCEDPENIIDDYKRIVKFTLGIDDPPTDHIMALWDLGYLPLRIRAVPEGTQVPLRVPVFTIENTKPEFFWLTNYFETLLSCEIWQPMTSATIAYEYRKVADKYALKTTGSTDGVNFQCHDFSMRGMEGVEPSAKSGMGHLLSFTGTDTIPAILAAEKYYGANVETELIGASIPATEHSVMCSYGQDEYGAFKRLLTEVYPNGFVSIVSDTWDLWKIMTEILPSLHNEIMNRDGRLVIRPDSGDPVDIICGDDYGVPGSTEASTKGVIELLWDEFGGTVTEQGYKVLDTHVGAIYGDSINLDRQKRIFERLEKKGFASTNIVFGVGSFTYQLQTRDTFGQAMKATQVTIGGNEINIFKDPITDKGHIKKSLTGRVVVVPDLLNSLMVQDGLTSDYQDIWLELDLLQDVFVDGKLVREQTFSEVRSVLGAIK